MQHANKSKNNTKSSNASNASLPKNAKSTTKIHKSPKISPKLSKENEPLLKQMAKELRFLCADIVENANSGHPGTPMGLAEVATTLSYHINLNPKNPKWLNRDRLVFSGGHASALLYSLLHLWGFDISLEDLRAFRKLDSKTPGHPEYPLTQGVEITTGPLGQGIANAVGFALSQKHANHILGKNAQNQTVLNHKVYCICGDGDLQEGISYEACSLAGFHKLDNLILIYDSNNITIEGEVGLAFSENVKARFEAQGFVVYECDGHDFFSIDSALATARANATAPTLIIVHTTIGKGASTLEGSHKTHGAPLGAEILARAKKEAGLDSSKAFFISDEVRFAFLATKEVGASLEVLWEKQLTKQNQAILDSLISPNFSAIKYPSFEVGSSIAMRSSNGKILNAISKQILGFVGGSADLAPSNNTSLENEGDFPNGKVAHFGIREHSMGAICNGVANYGLFLPFCATFFVFSDYMAASVRVASIMRSKVFYIWTHDSIGVGEDGATHQPIEQLSHFRAMPNLLVFRPADANENVACWQVALKNSVPCAFVLSRQNLPILDCALEPTSRLESIQKGAYIIKDFAKDSAKNPQNNFSQITLLASGSEVHTCLESAQILESSGIATRVVSMPCFDLALQNKEWVKSLLVGKVLCVEASRGLELYAFAENVLGMDSFGHSGKGDELFKYFGFSSQNIANRAKELLNNTKKC
ncbi:transketolase [Helicobacter sp. T3_23-1056]